MMSEQSVKPVDRIHGVVVSGNQRNATLRRKRQCVQILRVRTGSLCCNTNFQACALESSQAAGRCSTVSSSSTHRMIRDGRSLPFRIDSIAR